MDKGTTAGSTLRQKQSFADSRSLIHPAGAEWMMVQPGALQHKMPERRENQRLQTEAVIEDIPVVSGQRKHTKHQMHQVYSL